MTFADGGARRSSDAAASPADDGFRSGFVAVVGRPNVGKSTLINNIVGEKVLITSSRPQTTRNSIRCIWTGCGAQIIFIDTPGIQRPKNTLGQFMRRQALGTLQHVDVVAFMTDLSVPPGPGDRYLAGFLDDAEKERKVVVQNKVDLAREELDGELLQRRMRAYASLAGCDELLAISALSGENVEKLLELLLERLPEGPRYYPPDMMTDRPEQFVVAELIREKVFRNTREEIPYATAVTVDRMEEREDGMVSIYASIHVERQSQKGIIIGKKGRMLKRIGSEAREDIQGLLGTKVFLDLWVRVEKNWRRKAGKVEGLGYTDGG